MQRKVSVRSSPNYSTLGRCSSYQCMSDWRSSAARALPFAPASPPDARSYLDMIGFRRGLYGSVVAFTISLCPNEEEEE